jgi:hypothetical protein
MREKVAAMQNKTRLTATPARIVEPSGVPPRRRTSDVVVTQGWR